MVLDEFLCQSTIPTSDSRRAQLETHSINRGDNRERNRTLGDFYVQLENQDIVWD